MIRSPIQVPEEIKINIEGLKNKFYAKTNYEVIERLIAYYEKNESEKLQKKKEEESKHIILDEETKQKYIAFKREMGFVKDRAVFDFLYSHFESSNSIGKETFELFRKLS